MANDDKAIFSHRLATAMAERGIKQAELARKAKIDPSHINRYLSGKYEPKFKNVKALASALSVNIDWLIGLSDQMELSAADKENTIASINALLASCTLEQCQKALQFIKDYILS